MLHRNNSALTQGHPISGSVHGRGLSVYIQQFGRHLVTLIKSDDRFEAISGYKGQMNQCESGNTL